MDSILNTIKLALGIDADFSGFDTNLVLDINTAFWSLRQLGVGPPDGFIIMGENETWDQFLGNSTKLEAVKTYIMYSVRLSFDPPQSSSAQESYQRMLKELEWRLMVEVDPIFGQYTEEVVLAKSIYTTVSEVI